MTSQAQGRMLNVVWAVDPFESSPSAIRSAARAIRGLCKRSATRVLPVYARGGFEAETARAAQREGQARLERALRGLHVAPMESLAVPERAALRVTDAVGEVIEAARRRHADLIVVTARSGRGPRRLTMGSFAENLALRSDLPILSVQPGERLVRRFDPILFPTDFSRESRVAFDDLLGFAGRLGSRVVLFHKFRSSGYPVFEFPFAMSLEHADALAEEYRAIAREGERWCRAGRESRVRVDLEIDRSGLGRASDAILSRARRLHALVAIASRSGAEASLLLGSTTREVLRSADRPVWVIHPRTRLRLVGRDSGQYPGYEDRKVA